VRSVVVHIDLLILVGDLLEIGMCRDLNRALQTVLLLELASLVSR
jgi:hypothetical protein